MMKKILTSLSLLLVFAGAFCQRAVIVNHKNNFTVFSRDYNIPLYGVYEVDKHKVTGKMKVARPSNFKADPAVPGTNFGPDYLGSDYDRGHMMSAATNAYDAAGMQESFYYTNICPQTVQLNRSLWITLENRERDAAKANKHVTVYYGTYGVQSESIGKNNDISVPQYCWKVILTKNLVSMLIDTAVYLIPDSLDLDNDVDHYKTEYSKWQKKTGYSIDDIAALKRIKDPAARADYLIGRMKERLHYGPAGCPSGTRYSSVMNGNIKMKMPSKRICLTLITPFLRE